MASSRKETLECRHFYKQAGGGAQSLNTLAKAKDCHPTVSFLYREKRAGVSKRSSYLGTSEPHASACVHRVSLRAHVHKMPFRQVSPNA